MTSLARDRAIIEGLFRRLPWDLQAHILQVVTVARELASSHGIPLEQAEAAALAHDLARAVSPEALLQEARRLGMPVHPVEAAVPVLLHGPVAAVLLREHGVTDQELLEAVRWHSTGSRGTGPLARLIFLADKLDPGKAYPDREEALEVARKDLDRAMLRVLDRELAALLERGALIHPASVEARNEALERLAAKGSR